MALDHLVWLTLLSGLPFSLITADARIRAFTRFWVLEWKLGLAVGACVLFGMRFLNEPFGLPRLLTYGLVLAGMLLIKLRKGCAFTERAASA